MSDADADAERDSVALSDLDPSRHGAAGIAERLAVADTVRDADARALREPDAIADTEADADRDAGAREPKRQPRLGQAGRSVARCPVVFGRRGLERPSGLC